MYLERKSPAENVLRNRSSFKQSFFICTWFGQGCGVAQERTKGEGLGLDIAPAQTGECRSQISQSSCPPSSLPSSLTQNHHCTVPALAFVWWAAKALTASRIGDGAFAQHMETCCKHVRRLMAISSLKFVFDMTSILDKDFLQKV